MKRIIPAVVLAVVVGLGLVACGSGVDPDPAQTSVDRKGGTRGG